MSDVGLMFPSSDRLLLSLSLAVRPSPTPVALLLFSMVEKPSYLIHQTTSGLFHCGYLSDLETDLRD